MKKMISSMKTLVALLMVGATVTSCSSDDTIADQPVQQPVGPQVYTMTVEATKGGDGTRALNLDGNKLNATWTAGDEVEVWTEDGTTTKYGTLIAQSDGASTKLTGTLTTKPSDGETLTLKYLSPNYSSQDGTLTGTANSIDKVCDYATATVTATVDGDNVTTTAAAFENQQAVVKFTLKNGDDALSATKLVVAVGSTEYEVNPESAASEIYVAIPGFSGQTITLTATVGSDTYTYEKSGVTFANGKYYRVAVKMTKQAAVPTDALSGQFTVGMDGSTPRKVYFSKGNLQAKIASYSSDVATASEWKFADSQDSYIGNAAGNTTFVTGTWVDLFSWVGNSATYDTYGLITFTSSSQANHGNVSGESLKTDWGTAAVSSIGTGWYTLSMDEWKYVFGTNSGDKRSGATVGTTANARYTEATINTDGTGVNGVILFPDGATFAADDATWGTINAASAWGTKCTTAQWTALEAKGCVFLPAAGNRNGTSVKGVGSYSRYWSSTANGTDNAYCVYFGSGGVSTANYHDRYRGFSVRLVRDVPSN